MSEHARRRHLPDGPLPPDDSHTLGEEALHFSRWFLQSKYVLMGGFLGELTREPEERDPERLRERYCRALTHATRVQRARAAVTALLALGVIAAAASSVANLLDVPELLEGNVAATTALLERVAAWSASASVLLIVLRLAFDRYLQRVDIAATFLAIQLATAPRVKRASA